MDEKKAPSNKGITGSKILKQIIEIIPFSIFWKDSELNYIGCNKVFADAAGVKESQDIAGKTDYDLAWEKQEADFYRKCDQDVMEFDYELLNIEEAQRKADGTATTILTSKVPLHDDAGKVCGLLGVFSDITATKEKEERLHRQTIALNSISEGVLITNTDGIIIWANPSASRISGYSEKELIGSTPNLFQLEGTNLAKYAELLENIEEGHSWKGEMTSTGKEGNIIQAHLTITPVRNKKGQISSYVTNVVDLTTLKMLESKIEELSNN